jgi:hypothetical protein
MLVRVAVLPQAYAGVGLGDAAKTPVPATPPG